MIKKNLLLLLASIIFTMCAVVLTYAADIYNQPAIISEFTTKFNAGNTSRVQNIKLAAKAINDYVINPGETFSYNTIVGPTSKSKGFKLAKIFIKGKESKGYGGGVCQVSSTLYNAVLGTGCDIVERHPHSKKVTYVEEGRDAATSYGGIDFKFTNNYPYPIIVSAYTTKNSITVGLSEYLQIR